MYFESPQVFHKLYIWLLGWYVLALTSWPGGQMTTSTSSAAVSWRITSPETSLPLKVRYTFCPGCKTADCRLWKPGPISSLSEYTPKAPLESSNLTEYLAIPASSFVLLTEWMMAEWNSPSSRGATTRVPIMDLLASLFPVDILGFKV